MSSNNKENKPGVMAFTFGEPEPVHNINILDYLSTNLDTWGRYYKPPISLEGLSKMPRANAHHGSCLIFRRNAIVNEFIPSPGLALNDYRCAATDYLNFGQAYFKKITDLFGRILELRHVPALNVRIGREDGQFFWLQKGQTPQEFAHDELISVGDYDTLQEIYGVPDWLGGMQSALLNQDATLFRRKYYKNGAHLGYILYTSEASLGSEDEEAISKAVAGGKGAGNFRSMYLHIPNGKEKGVQLIPVGDINQKDQFDKIKAISADDVIVAHRVHPALVAVKPEAQSAFGDIEKIESVYRRTETMAATHVWTSLNKLLPPNLQFKFRILQEIDNGDTN